MDDAPVMKQTIRKRLAGLFGLLLVFLTAAVFTACGKSESDKNVINVPPVPPASVVDLADAFSSEEEQMLLPVIGQFERSSCGEIRILTVHNTDGLPLEEFSLAIANKWEIGKGKGGGVLLLLVMDEHRNRIEVSLEWEDVLTDARCADVLKSIVPELRDGKYADACAKAVRAMEVFFPK